MERLQLGRLSIAIAFALGTFLLLTIFKQWAPIHLDSGRDLLIARECAIGSHCPGAGAPTSFHGFFQGALWPRVLELRDLSGVGLAALERIVDALFGAAAGVVAWVGYTTFDRRSALWTWVLWFPVMLSWIEYPNLWNPSLLPIGMTLFQGALFHGVRVRRARWFLLAAIAGALTIELHLVNAVEIPFLLFAIVAYAPRPAVVAPAAMVILLALIGIDSPGAVAKNLHAAQPYTLLIVAAMVTAVGGGIWARHRLPSQPDGDRVWTLAVGQIAYVALLLVGLSVVTGHGFTPRYCTAAIAPFAWIIGRSRVRTWLAACAVFVVVGLHLKSWAVDRPHRAIKLHDVDAIATELYGRGLSFAYLRRHLRGPNAFDLLSVLAAMEPHLTEPNSASAGPDILVFRTSRSALPGPLPAAWKTVKLDGKDVAVIASYQPFVETDQLEVCCGDLELHPTCVRVRVDQDFDPRRRTDWLSRSYPSLASLKHAFPESQLDGTRVSYRLAVRVPPSVRPRAVFALQSGRELAWRIDRASGTDETLFPATQVHLGAQPQPDGSIVFSTLVPKGRSFEFRAWLPAYAELPEGVEAEVFRAAIRPTWVDGLVAKWSR